MKRGSLCISIDTDYARVSASSSIFLAILGHSAKRVLNSLRDIANMVESKAARTVASLGSFRMTALSPTTAPGAIDAISFPSFSITNWPWTSQRTSFPNAPWCIRMLPFFTSMRVVSLQRVSSSWGVAEAAKAKSAYCKWWFDFFAIINPLFGGGHI